MASILVRFTATVFATLAVASNACAITIDDFSAGPFSIEVLRHETESVTLSDLDTQHVLGGSRYVTLNGLGPTPESSVRVSVDSTGGKFQYDADRGSSAANFRVSYGQSAALHANLLVDGANALVFNFESVEFENGVGYFDITVTTSPGGRYLYVPVTNSSSPSSLVLPFRAFSSAQESANFADVVSIRFGTGNGNLRGDYVLDGIHTAFYPEGDYNFDGQVDLLDYDVWEGRFGNQGSSGGAYPVDPADGNRDGTVNAADFVIWRDNLGESSGGSDEHVAVPEPSAISSIVLVAIYFATARYRMRQKRGRSSFLKLSCVPFPSAV